MTERYSGILAHITSIPQNKIFDFIDFLELAGQKLWQILPIGPTGSGNSPYQSPSAFAGNPNFFSNTDLKIDDLELEQFKKNNEYWILDYALFKVLKELHNDRAWNEWPDEYKFRGKKSLKKIEELYRVQIDDIMREQLYFEKSWNQIKNYANKKGIKIVGDIPIFVSTDSADAWAHKELFKFNEQGEPIEVSGVPPDLFSQDGQLWGNVLYDWAALKETNYEWWVRRFEQAFKRHDILRVDHFRGFEAFWSIKSGCKTARIGEWKKGPGIDLFREIEKDLGKLSIIAEDLGFITPEVKELLKETGFPGMKVLEFAFDSKGESEYLPENCSENSVMYTGTHDNMTLVEWYASIDKETKKFCKQYVKKYLEKVGGDRTLPMNWKLIQVALASPCRMSIVPIQDYLGLGAEGRMNIPGTPLGNWEWKMKPEAFNKTLAKKIKTFTKIYDR